MFIAQVPPTYSEAPEERHIFALVLKYFAPTELALNWLSVL